MVERFLGVTLFLSAFLLFWSQPMIAKMVLPLFGGSASVWTTCVLFFQTALLGGYVYAHLLSKTRLSTQVVLHAVGMAAVLIFLPLTFGEGTDPATLEQPAIRLLLDLIRTAGLPLFVLSATAPLLQNWLGLTTLESRRNPYFLYSASNAGSLLALIAYPLLVEPRLGLVHQSWTWSLGYGLLILLILCGSALIRKNAGVPAEYEDHLIGPRPPARARACWLAATFVPSALMLAVTNHISMNVAPIPFLWMLPLAVYLLTFILAFAKTADVSGIQLAQISRWSPILLLLLLPIVPDIAAPKAALNWMLIAGHLMILFVGSYLCHTAVAARRPDPRYLTEFYICIACGGALGGVFAAIIAPRIFSTLLEYPLLFAALPFFRLSKISSLDAGRSNWRDWAFPAIVGAVFAANWYVQRLWRIDIADSYAVLVPDGLLFIVVLLFVKRWLRFGLSFAVLLFGYVFTLPPLIENGERLYVVRNFFGVKKVLFDGNTNLRRLLHGDTLHGVESMDPLRSGEPLSYYHTTGPAGEVMDALHERPSQKVGVVGLGTGSMAAYAGPNRQITFFDVDPQVEEIAQRFFTYLRRCGEQCNVIIADGRIAIDQFPDGAFDLLMMDAFSSDSIPTHLLSREALRTYILKLKLDGLLLFHVSNRYLRIDQLVARMVIDAGLTGLSRSDRDGAISGKSGSDYVVAARNPAALEAIARKENWEPISPEGKLRPWSDDYSNLLGLVKWF